MIMDIMLSTITDQKNRARMNTPIVMSLFKADDNPNSVKSILSEKGLWTEDDNRDLSYLENSYTSLKSMKVKPRKLEDSQRKEVINTMSKDRNNIFLSDKAICENFTLIKVL